MAIDGEIPEEIRRRHDSAVDAGVPVYADPISGLSVFTEGFLADRGYCCGSGCRHCPYPASPVADPVASETT